jgi:histone H3/H4
MESLIVLSKVKKYIKEKAGFSTSASFFDPLNKDIQSALINAIDHTKKAERKTVMGRDFNFYVDKPEINEVLVVASKIKNYVKEESELSTSKQCMEQLTVRVQMICDSAIENATSSKRKTVMDKDYNSPAL